MQRFLSTFANRRLLQPSLESYTDVHRYTDPDFGPGPKRLFKPKETYRPRDLNDKHASDYVKRAEQRLKPDVLELLRLDPLREYKNVSMLSHFVTEMGHIKKRKDTGLSVKNQNKVSKAIKRAQAMGRKILESLDYSISDIARHQINLRWMMHDGKIVSGKISFLKNMIHSAFDDLDFGSVNSLYQRPRPTSSRSLACLKNPKLEQIKYERNLEIDRANSRLIKNIMGIHQRSQCSLSRGGEPLIKSHAQCIRMKESKRIEEENRRLLKKLESASAKSTYGKDKLISEWSRSREHVARISAFQGPKSTPATPTRSLSTASLSWDAIKEGSDAIEHSILSLNRSVSKKRPTTASTLQKRVSFSNPVTTSSRPPFK